MTGVLAVVSQRWKTDTHGRASDTLAVPHGGYVTSTFLRVAESHFRTTLCSQLQPDTITLHLDFLRRTSVGNALFTVKDVKRGRQTSVIHITLSQDDREEVVGYVTNTNLTTETGVTFVTGWELSLAPPPVSLPLLRSNMDANWARQTSMPFSDFRKASKKVFFHFPRTGQSARNISDSWLRFANGERFTNESLGYLSDMFPMPVEAFLGDEDPYAIATAPRSKRAAKFWYPTLLLNLDIKKKLPQDGVEWLFSRCLTKSIRNGRSDLEIVICDESGEIVALSHHVTLVLDAQRNLSERSKPSITSSKI